MSTEDKLEQQQLRLIDKYLESVYVYWSALLTINGLLLTFFSIDALSSTDRVALLVYLLIGSCILSLWLIIWNFRTIKLTYYKLGRTTTDDMPDVPEEIRKTARSEEDIRRLIDQYTAEWRQEQHEKVIRKQESMMQRETIVEGLMVLETLLVVLVLLTQS